MALSVKIKYLPNISFGVVQDDSIRVTEGLLNKIELVVIEPVTPAATTNKQWKMMMGIGI